MLFSCSRPLSLFGLTALSGFFLNAVLAVSIKSSTPANIDVGRYTVSEATIMQWLADADPSGITFIGEAIMFNPLATRSAQNTVVTYCSTITDNGAVCENPCTVYNGGATCLSAPNTNCLSASNDVTFCNGGGCSGSCTDFSSCPNRIEFGFCSAPGTNSISVSSA